MRKAGRFAALVLHRGRTHAEGAASQVLTEALMSEVFEVAARVLREPQRDRPYIVFWPGNRQTLNDQPERRHACSSP